jgi:hypothetical protein
MDVGWSVWSELKRKNQNKQSQVKGRAEKEKTLNLTVVTKVVSKNQ